MEDRQGLKEETEMLVKVQNIELQLDERVGLKGSHQNVREVLRPPHSGFGSNLPKQEMTKGFRYLLWA